jgi:hypothetical protein
MLLDRACPQGGWNAGTPYCVTVDFDTLDDGAVTIRERDAMTQERVSLDKVQDYLATRLNTSCSPYYLAWALIALSAYGHRGSGHLRGQLEVGTASRLTALPNRVLGIAALALEQPSFTLGEISQ